MYTAQTMVVNHEEEDGYKSANILPVIVKEINV